MHRLVNGMSKKYILLFFVVFTMVVSFVGCEQTPVSTSSEAPQIVEYPLFIGDVKIEEMPQAVVSLSPATTEILFDMGYESRIMGVSEFCDYPPEALDKLPCGSALGLDKKAISLRPVDLVVTTTPLMEQDLIWFQQQNIPVLVLPFGNNWEEIKDNYLNLATAMSGLVTGAAYGQIYYAQLEEKLDYSTTLADQYLLNNPPLRSVLLREMSYTMATGETFEQLILDHLQLTNEGGPYTNWLYPRAEVVALDPDVMFCHTSISIDTVKNSVVYKPVQAVIHDKIMNIDFTILDRQSPRMFDLIESMAVFAYGTP